MILQLLSEYNVKGMILSFDEKNLSKKGLKFQFSSFFTFFVIFSPSTPHLAAQAAQNLGFLEKSKYAQNLRSDP